MTAYAADRIRHEDQIRHVLGRAEEVAELRKTREPKGTLKTTTAIAQANAEIWPDNEARAAQTVALWQSGSGDTHALGWSILTRGYDMTPLGEGMGHFAANPSMKEVGDAYLRAYDFVAFGLHRLDELGVA